LVCTRAKEIVLYDQFFVDEQKNRADLVRRFLLFANFAIVLALPVRGQELPKAVLVDEFASVPCGDLLSRTDSFFAELMKHPADGGYVIIFPNAKNAKGYKAWINAATYYRRFDRSRIRIVAATKPSGAGAAAQFWRIPPGSSLPEFDLAQEEPRPLSKPYIFGYADENGVCPSFNPADFANVIEQNPGSYGKLVVRGNSWSNRKSFVDSVVGTLRGEGLSNAQVRVFYVHRPKSFLTEAEFWFVPANK
jgi:hypothetical protein